jgi:hypothetical protein
VSSCLSSAPLHFGLVSQICNAGSRGQYPDEKGIKFVFSFIKRTKPRNELEAAVIRRTAATHASAMPFAKPSMQGMAERAFNGLTRTFAAQILQQHRSRDQQKRFNVKRVYQGWEPRASQPSRGPQRNEPASRKDALQRLMKTIVIPKTAEVVRRRRR